MMKNLQSSAFVAKTTQLLSSVANLRLLLVMLLTLTASAEVWGADVTLQPSSKCWTTTLGEQTGTINGITISTTNGQLYYNKNNNPTQFRINSGATFSVTSSVGNITKIVFTFSTDSYQGGLSTSYSNINSTSWSATLNGDARIQKIVVTYTEGPAYTVNWTISPAAGGTLSATTGNSITVTPNATYTYGNPAYTVSPEGKATVSQNTNTFTATPTEDCTIQINMVEKQKNTYIDQVQGNSESVKYDTHNTPTLADKTQTTTGTCEQQHWHFMGWVTEANKENPTDVNIVKANTSVTANGTTFYAVWAKGTTTGGGSTSKQYSFDITPSNFNSTSYAANNNEKTSTATATDGSTMDVKWTSYQVMNQSSAMQWQKNNGYIYNSTDLGEITDITIEITEGTFTQYINSSKQPTTNGTGGYFQIKVGGATGKVSSIKVTFTLTEEGESTTTYSDYITSCITETLVTLHPNGGDGEETTATIEGTTYTVTDCSFTRDGYTFSHWDTQADDSGVDYDPDDIINLNGTPITLYAQWECTMASISISGAYALTQGQEFLLTAIAKDSEGNEIECPDDAIYTWQYWDGSNWQDVNDNESSDKTKLQYASCNVVDHCGKFRCIISYGDCIAYSNTNTQDDGYKVHVYHIKGFGEWSTPYPFIYDANTGEAVLTMELEAYTPYEFSIFGSSTQFFNGGTITANATDWVYGLTNYGNTKITTTIAGVYIFTLDYSEGESNNLKLDVTYPSKRIIYLEPNIWGTDPKFAVHAWGGNSTEDILMTKIDDCASRNIYYAEIDASQTNVTFIRGNTDNYDISNPWENVWNQTVDLTLGNDNLFYVDNWHDANDYNKSNGYWTTFTPNYLVTFDVQGHGTAPEDQCIAENGTATTPTAPTATGYTFGGWYKEAGCTNAYDFSTAVTSSITLYAKWTANIHTLTWDVNSGNALTGTYTSGSVAYGTVIIKPADPTRTDYTFNGWSPAFVEGTTMPDNDLTYTAQWKFIPTLQWSAPSCTAALEADNDYPDLTTNPADLTGITYSSSNTSVATIDSNTGEITLVGVGETTITASFAGNGTYAPAADASYTLNVVESNCRWVEVTGNTTLEDGDEVVITMSKGLFTWTISNTKNTSTAPTANDITANIQGNYLTTVSDEYKWVIEKDNANLTFYSYSDNANYLYCTNDANGNGVRVGTGTAKVFVVDGNYLKNTQTTDPRYVGISFNTNPYTWRCYTDTTGVIADETLKFYKRECLDSEHYWVTWDAGEGTWEDGSTKKLESYQEGETITEPSAPSREDYRFDGWTPTPETMPAQNTTFTAKWTKVYTITWYENGVPSYTYVPSDNPIVTWEDGIADCGEKKFYGWTADNTFVSHATTPPACVEKGITIDGDVTYYAVYADAEEPANPGYEKVTTISEGTYLIATGETENNKAYTGKYPDKQYGGTCEVTVGNSVISTKPNDAVEVIVLLGTGDNANKFAIYDGTYYLSAPDDNELTFNDNIVYDWKLTAEGHINSTGQSARYIQLNSSANPNRFACYSSNQKKAYLYKKQTTTYENFAVSCATYVITITPPAGGTVTTTPADEAGAGQTITVNVTPADCKYLTALKYNDGSDHSINISSTPYTFTMPAADVTVTATFADKTATDIEILTSAHRNLMQGSAFVGEQIKVTYDNGETETLDWDDTRLTFSGYNMATLGTYTVRVDYNDCGTANTSYSIEVIDGIAITFIDAGISETIKYELNAHVDVETKTGQYACSGHEFVGWSETEFPLSDVPNMRTSEEYVPVRNFNATTSRTLYAVYSILKKQGWVSIEDANHIRSGAEYMIVKNRYGTYSALSTTTSTYNANYRAATILDKDEDDSTGNMIVWRRTSDNTDFQIYTGTATNDVKWLLIKKDNKNYLYNQTEKKYLQVTTTAITLTSEMADNFKITDESGDCCLNIQSATSNYYISGYNSSNNYYFQPYSTETDANYLLTRDSLFTTTPPCSPLYATFYGNGGIVTDGIKSGDYLTIKEPTRDAGITTPTASFADCNGKTWTFVGWAREEIDVTRIPVLTTDLLHDGGGNKHYNIEKNGEEFWAVYTNTGDPETKYGTITLTVADFDFNSYQTGRLTKEVLGDSYIIDYKDVGCPSGSGNGIQIAQMSEKNGYIMNTTSLGKINSIKFTNFERGDIDDIRVYVGNTPDDITTLLTVEELQTVGDASTYYPNKNYSYFKIQSNKYTGIETISIDFGKGTQIWATTPDCSTITLSGDEIYVTATNGRAVMAPATLTVKANQLEANADVILTSNSSDVYFSTDRTFNFAAGQAANQKPTASLTLPTDAEGNLATTDVYIHYMPSSEGNGVPADVVISANLETPNPSISDDHTIHVRNLPAKFVIATKVGATWYALPADMNTASNPLGVVIEVDETNMTATAPNSCTYTLFPVKTTNTEYDRYEEYGDRLRFSTVNNSYKGLWANNSKTDLTINNDMVIDQASDGQTGSDLANNSYYEWKVTTTVVDGHWQYTLQTDQTQNQNYLRYWTSAEGTPVGPKWGTYNAGENRLYFLPVTETQPFEYDVVEWYPTKMLIQTDAAIASPTVKIRGEKVATPVLTSKGGKLYEISNLPLETNPNEVLQVSFTADAINYVNAKVVPIILSRGEKSITGEPFATLTQKVYQYADIVVRDGATLTIDGGTDVANTLLGMTIYPTAKVSVAEGKKLSVHNLTFFGGIDEIYDGSAYTINKYGVPQLSLKGILNKTITNMDYIMRVNLDQMYQVGVPYDVNLSDITYWDGTTMTLGDNLYVSAYDGQKRANREEKSWVWETDFTEKVLKAGIGYTISADKQDAAHEYSIIRMPMKNNITSGNTETAKTVQVYAYDNKNGVEITDNHKGWNYLSNPYMVAISGAEADSKLVVGYLRETGTGPWEWVDDTYRYVTIPSDDGKWYDQQQFEKATLLPFKSFFLQIATSGELSFALASRQGAPARYLQSSNEQREVEFEVLLANDTRSDNLGFLIGEDYTPAYEINADLEKMIGSMSVYTIYNGYNLAYNALSPTNAAEQIPIGYVVPTVGEYTFALDESSDIEDVEHIYLIDYETSAITDLVTDVYTFTTLEQKSDTRFAINVALKSKDNTATGLDNMNTNGELPTKFIYQDKIYILHHGVIYDATGKRVITINK